MIEGKKESILAEAERVIYGDREKTYGSPGKNLTNIAQLWEMYLRGRGLLDESSSGVFHYDVANMMILLKIARLANNPGHRDSLVDIAGYAALVDRIEQEKSGG
jgi:hypothetical protein